MIWKLGQVNGGGGDDKYLDSVVVLLNSNNKTDNAKDDVNLCWAIGSKECSLS